MLETLFNLKYCEIFRSTYFEEYLRAVVSENIQELGKVKIVDKGF